MLRTNQKRFRITALLCIAALFCAGSITPSRAAQESTATLTPTDTVSSPSFLSVTMINAHDGWAEAMIQNLDASIMESPFRILHTHDGGKTWSVAWQLPHSALIPNNPNPPSPVFLDDRHAWVYTSAIDNNVLLWRTSDGGQNWLESAYRFNYTPNTLEFVDPLHGWMLADNGPAAGSEQVSLYQTSDGGKSWQRLWSQDSSCCITRITFESRFEGWMTTSANSWTGHLFSTRDGGVTWNEVTMPNPPGPIYTDDTHRQLANRCTFQGLAVFKPGSLTVEADCEPANPGSGESSHSLYLLHSADDGVSWQVSMPKSPFQFVSIRMITPLFGFDTVLDQNSATNAQWLMETTDGGKNWGQVFQLTGDLDQDTPFDFIDQYLGWVVSNNDLLHTTDGGKTWTPLKAKIMS